MVALVPAAADNHDELLNRLFPVPRNLAILLGGKKQAKGDLFNGGGDDQNKVLQFDDFLTSTAKECSHWLMGSYLSRCVALKPSGTHSTVHPIPPIILDDTVFSQAS